MFSPGAPMTAKVRFPYEICAIENPNRLPTFESVISQNFETFVDPSTLYTATIPLVQDVAGAPTMRKLLLIDIC